MPFGFEGFRKKAAVPAESNEAEPVIKEFKESKSGVTARYIEIGDHIEVTISGRIVRSNDQPGSSMPGTNAIFKPEEKASAEALYERTVKAITESAAQTDDWDATYEAGAGLFSAISQEEAQ